MDAGVDVIQVRERDLDSRDLQAVVEDIVGLTRGGTTRVVVNERVDVALACGADGVHLRADAPPADVVRRMTPERFVVGRSVHSVMEAAAAGPVDYLIAGTLFPTRSKGRDTPLLGVQGLAEIVRAVRVPVLGIGGVTVEQAAEVAAAGAAGLAAIGLFMNETSEDPASCRAMPLGAVVGALRRRFDSVKTAS